MGPFRRRLTVALAVLPVPALADVCADVRNGWQAASGPATAWGEGLYILSSPAGLVALALLAIGLWRPSPWRSAFLAFPALALAALILFSRQAPTAQQAAADGCIGSPVLGVAVLAGLAVFAIVRGWRNG